MDTEGSEVRSDLDNEAGAAAIHASKMDGGLVVRSPGR